MSNRTTSDSWGTAWDPWKCRWATRDEYLATLDERISLSCTWRYRIVRCWQQLRRRVVEADTAYLLAHRSMVEREFSGGASDNAERLTVRDRLDDLMAGFDFWREQKCSTMELTTLDEMFIRWVEGCPESQITEVGR